MLNRRHLRIKVFQILYAFQQSEVKDLRAFEKKLFAYIDKVYELYLYMLLLMMEIAEHEETAVKERAVRFTRTAEDMNARPHLPENKLIIQLHENEEFKALVKNRQLSWASEPELIRQLFNELKNTPEYGAYASIGEKTYKQDQDFILFILKNIISVSPALEQHLEEKHINWSVDREVIIAMVSKTLKSFTETSKPHHSLLSLTSNWNEDKQFVLDLFQKTILNDEQYQEYINSKTKNWDPDRIAMTDTILMKMALCELLHFPSIPVKVSINEYIEISKEFSTPKSKVFINGILDSLLIELKETGIIRKTGRGLLE